MPRMENPFRDFAAFLAWLYAAVDRSEDIDTILAYVDSLGAEQRDRLQAQLDTERQGAVAREQAVEEARELLMETGTLLDLAHPHTLGRLYLDIEALLRRLRALPWTQQ
jgi:hypothetical protein